jgi:hypothetical protein
VTTTKKRVLALDVSTKAGWCVLDSDEVSGAVEMELVSQGLLMLPKPSDFEDPYPWSYIKAADAAADILVELIVRVQPDAVVVEETNLAKARYTQKLLEFLHYALIHRIGEKVSAGFLTVPVFYLSSMVWRQKLGLVMTKADKGNNKLLKQAKAAYAAAKKTFVPQQVVSPAARCRTPSRSRCRPSRRSWASSARWTPRTSPSDSSTSGSASTWRRSTTTSLTPSVSPQPLPQGPDTATAANRGCNGARFMVR